jgi:hypothetical protein
MVEFIPTSGVITKVFINGKEQNVENHPIIQQGDKVTLMEYEGKIFVYVLHEIVYQDSWVDDWM